MSFPEEPQGDATSRSTGGAGAEPSRENLRELGLGFSRREKTAFEEVFRHFREAVYVIGLLELGDPEEAQDLVQETFRRAWSSARTLSDPERLRPWLFAIARNLCVDLAKRSQRRPTPVQEIPEWRLREKPQSAPLPSMIRQEKANRVQHLLNSVPDRFRMVLAMRLLEERSYQEIAEVLEMPLHGVKNAISRGGRILVEKIRNTPDLSAEGES
jgi:RNA polymerase sigma-70 factor (ECF subfamily)